MSNIHAALVAALGELTNPTKDRKANAGHFSYSYADLASVLDHVRGILAEHELGVTQNIVTEDGKLEVWTYIHHSSGDVLTYGPIVGRAGVDWQQLGAGVTYARRYALGAALGIAPEDDDDAASTKLPVSREPKDPEQYERDWQRMDPTNKPSKIQRVKPSEPVIDEWSTPVDPETGEAATLEQAVETVAEKLGGEPVRGDRLKGPARRDYDNTKRGPSSKQLYVITQKMKATFDEVVDEDTALLKASTYLVETGDAQPGEVNDWTDLTRRMIDRLFQLGGGK